MNKQHVADAELLRLQARHPGAPLVALAGTMPCQRHQLIALVEVDLVECAPGEQRAGRHDELGGLLVFRLERMLLIDRCIVGVEISADHARILHQALRRVAHVQLIPGREYRVGQWHDCQTRPTGDCPHLHRATGLSDHVGERRAVGRAACLDAHLGDEDARRGVGNCGALRQQMRGDEPQIENADAARDRCGLEKIEHVKLRHPEAHRGTDHQQVERGADRCTHAADLCGEGHRHQCPRGRTARAQCDGGEDRNHQRHERRVVHEGAENGSECEHHRKCEHRARRPEARDEAAEWRKCAGAHESLACHHEPADCDERLVAEAEEKIRRFERTRGCRVRKEDEAGREQRDDEEARSLDREVFAREEHEGERRQDEYGDGMRVESHGRGQRPCAAGRSAAAGESYFCFQAPPSW